MYCYCSWFTWRRLGEVQSQLWVLIWLVAATLTLVPAHLIEPRYLTTAVVVAHAHAPERTWTATAVTAAGCILVNAATVALFLYKVVLVAHPFHSPWRCRWTLLHPDPHRRRGLHLSSPPTHNPTRTPGPDPTNSHHPRRSLLRGSKAGRSGGCGERHRAPGDRGVESGVRGYSMWISSHQQAGQCAEAM